MRLPSRFMNRCWTGNSSCGTWKGVVITLNRFGLGFSWPHEQPKYQRVCDEQRRYHHRGDEKCSSQRPWADADADLPLVDSVHEVNRTHTLKPHTIAIAET